MQFIRKPNGVSVKPCQAADPYGNRCGNRGIKVDVLTVAINFKLEELEERLLRYEQHLDKDELLRSQEVLDFKQSELSKLEKALVRIKELYEIRDYTREEYQERKKARSREIQLLSDEIEGVNAKLNHYERKTTEERISKIKSFKEIWSSNAARRFAL